MAVFQVSRLRVQVGRLDEYLDHLDDIKAVNERYGLKSRRILNASLAGEQTGELVIISEFEDLVAQARWAQERKQDPEYQAWQKTTANSNPDSPATILSMILLTEIVR